MKIKKVKIKLPEGEFGTDVIEYDNNDKNKISETYKKWIELCDNLSALFAREVNLPEGLSEPVFCISMNTVRVVNSISGANTSFDCYDLNRNKRIQVKACSVIPDLTSFGPKSEWDEIYFMDFYVDGKWDGTFHIYLIDNYSIYNHKVNSKQTLKEQQSQGKRPRFSIYTEIIKKNSLKPVFKGNVNTL